MKHIFIFVFLFYNLLYSQFYDHAEVNINNIEAHYNNYGGLTTSKNISPSKSWLFDGETILFSGGFLLSGQNGDSLFGNGVSYSDHIQDYLPGNVNADPNDERFEIYKIEITDIDFGESWQDWKSAVELGALFYDGDNDGSYNPIDLNSNGKWDETEDKPDLIGDYTAWCVYNDAVLKEDRLFPNTEKMGIEIRQTVFAYNNMHDENLSNTIFIRYIIENVGIISAKFDSVYFGLASDPDIGIAYAEDYGGSDTTLNSIYAYKRNPDDSGHFSPGFGNNPPAVFNLLLQGPHAYIPNITFIDNNGNGEYNEGIDTPIDSDVINRGEILGIKAIPGATNLDMTAAITVTRSHPTYGMPNNESELQNYLMGYDKFGTSIDIANFDVGNGDSLKTEEIENLPPQYWFSGDPVSNEGWQCIKEWDYRLINSTGPFELKINEPVEVMAAYIVGRGDSPLNSITFAKEIVENIIDIYDRNFTNIPVSVETQTSNIVTEFSLSQNYPNPFNPSTVITYSIPEKSFVRLKVFNILGEKVVELVNAVQEEGIYNINFNADDLPSGIYIYRFSADSFQMSKKMVLLR